MKRLLLIAAVLAVAGCEGPSAPAPPPAPAAPAPPPAPAAPAPPISPAARDTFDALGTEPFWAVKIRVGQIELSGLDRKTQTWPNPGVRWQGGSRSWFAHDADSAIKIRLTLAPCSDGMSDRIYPYTVEVVTGEEVLKGCASRAAR